MTNQCKHRHIMTFWAEDTGSPEGRLESSHDVHTLRHRVVLLFIYHCIMFVHPSMNEYHETKLTVSWITIVKWVYHFYYISKFVIFLFRFSTVCSCTIGEIRRTYSFFTMKHNSAWGVKTSIQSNCVTCWQHEVWLSFYLQISHFWRFNSNSPTSPASLM